MPAMTTYHGGLRELERCETIAAYLRSVKDDAGKRVFPRVSVKKEGWGDARVMVNVGAPIEQDGYTDHL